MSVVEGILKRMKEQRLGNPIRGPVSPRKGGEAYSTRVAVVQQKPKKTGTVSALVPASCKTFSKKGAGAAAMTVPELIEFIKKKAHKPVFDKFARLQKKTRPALCDLLSEFEEGYRLLYPKSENKPNTPPMELPAANNLGGMFNLAQKLQNAQVKKNVKKIIERRNGLIGSPASPVSSIGGNNTLGTPNYINYGNNNNAAGEEARVRERNAYLRKLAEKRVVRDPLEGKLSAANMKRFRVQPVKNMKKIKRAPIKRSRSITNLSLMKMNDGNMRVPTVATRGLKISTSPRVNQATMRSLKNQAVRMRNTLNATLRKLRAAPVKNRTAINRMRIRFLSRRLADPQFENKFVNKEKYRVTLMQRLGLASPPKPRSPPKKAFSMVGNTTAVQNARLANMTKKNKVNKKNDPNLERKILASMNAARKRQANYRGILNYKIEGKPCMSYKKSQLVKAARLVTKGRIANLNSFTKEDLCRIIKENRGKK